MKMLVSAEARGDSPVHDLSAEFFRAAEDFAGMQQEHQAALLAGNCKDLFSWRQGRELAFRGLARILERVAACGQEGQECIAHAHEIMKKLLGEEAMLQELILARQLNMQEQLQAMRKGKEALQGYNIHKGLVPRPRYLSSRM